MRGGGAVGLVALLLSSGCIVGWDPRPYEGCGNIDGRCFDLPDPDVRAQLHGYTSYAVPGTLRAAKGQVIEWEDQDPWFHHRFRLVGIPDTEVLQEDRNLTWELGAHRFRARVLTEGTFSYSACEGCPLATLVVLPEGVPLHNPPAIQVTDEEPGPFGVVLRGVAFHPEGLPFSASVTVGDGAPLPLPVVNGTWSLQRHQVLARAGTYPYRLQAVDGRGLESHQDGTVTLLNRMPVLRIDEPAQGAEVRLPFVMRGHAYDPEGDEFTVTWFPGGDARQPWNVIPVHDGRWEATVPEGTFEPGHAQISFTGGDEPGAFGLAGFLVVEVVP